MTSSDPGSGTGRRILLNTFYRSSADIVSKIVMLALYAVVARELGKAGFGLLNFALSLSAVVTVLGNFGQDTVMVREVARDRTLLDHYFFNNIVLKTILQLPAIAIVVLVLAASGSDRNTVAAVALIGLATVAEDLVGTCSSVFQAFERMAFHSVTMISLRLATALGGIALVVAGGGIQVVAAAYLVAALGALILAYIFVTRIERPRWNVSAKAWGPLMRASVPIGLGSMFAIVLFRIDMTMLAALRSPRAVGLYGAAYRLLETTLFLSWSVGAAVYPIFSRLSSETVPSLTDTYAKAMKLIVALTFPFGIGAAVFAPDVLASIFGPEYEEAATALRLLAPTIALFPVAYVCSYLLIAQRRQWLATTWFGVTAVQNIIFNFILIPALSLEGAAINTSISQVLITTAFVISARRIVGRVAWTPVLAGPSVASACAVLAMLPLRSVFVLAMGVGSVVYAAALFLFERAFFPNDIALIRRMLKSRAARL